MVEGEAFIRKTDFMCILHLFLFLQQFVNGISFLHYTLYDESHKIIHNDNN